MITLQSDLMFDRNWAVKHPGAIVHLRSYGFYPENIRRLLGSWGNHDALVIAPDAYHTTRIGDAEPFFAKCKPLTEYDKFLSEGCEVRVLLPNDWTYELGLVASATWRNHIEGRFYDGLAIFYILIARLFNAAGIRKRKEWEWAWFCTEGVCRSYIDKNYWKKECCKATPLTTEHRVADGTFIDVTDDALRER